MALGPLAMVNALICLGFGLSYPSGFQRRRQVFFEGRVQTWARSSAGRAPGLHPGGRRFEPGRVHQDLRGHLGPIAQSG